MPLAEIQHERFQQRRATGWREQSFEDGARLERVGRRASRRQRDPIADDRDQQIAQRAATRFLAAKYPAEPGEPGQEAAMIADIVDHGQMRLARRDAQAAAELLQPQDR